MGLAFLPVISPVRTPDLVARIAARIDTEYNSQPLPLSITTVCGTNTARQRPVAFENGVPNQGTWA